MLASTFSRLLKNPGAALALLGLCAASSHAQTFTTPVAVTIATSAVSSTQGYYEFQFNPAAGNGSVTNPLTTKLTNISYNGVSAPNITFSNAGAGGDAFVAMTKSFGPSFVFDYAFSPGTLPVPDTGDDLEVFFYKADQSQIVTTDPSGNDLVADIHITPGITAGAPFQVSISQFGVGPAAVPEASTTVSLGLLLALGALALAVRKKSALLQR